MSDPLGGEADDARDTVHREGLVGGHLVLSHVISMQVYGEERPSQEEIWTKEFQDKVNFMVTCVMLLFLFDLKVFCVNK